MEFVPDTRAEADYHKLPCLPPQGSFSQPNSSTIRDKGWGFSTTHIVETRPTIMASVFSYCRVFRPYFRFPNPNPVGESDLGVAEVCAI